MFGSVPFFKATAAISIDGSPVKTFTNDGDTFGHWVSTETGPDANGQYRLTWTWVADSADASAIKLTCYPSALAFRDGEHQVTATVRDTSNAVWTDTWTYDVQIPPTVGAPTPAAGARVTTSTPGHLDSDRRQQRRHALDGPCQRRNRVGRALRRRLAHHVAEPPERRDDHRVRHGLRRGRQLDGQDVGVLRQATPDMTSTIAACTGCHKRDARHWVGWEPCIALPPARAAHPGDAGCDAHPSRRHGLLAVSRLGSHGRARDGDTTSAGSAMTCVSCHKSADPAVVSAIASGNSSCASCHSAAASHEALHTVPTTTCTTCHGGTSLTSVHAAQGLACETCHASTDPRVVSAIATHQRDCSACHDPHALEASFCYGCHGAPLRHLSGPVGRRDGRPSLGHDRRPRR